MDTDHTVLPMSEFYFSSGELYTDAKMQQETPQKPRRPTKSLPSFRGQTDRGYAIPRKTHKRTAYSSVRKPSRKAYTRKVRRGA